MRPAWSRAPSAAPSSRPQTVQRPRYWRSSPIAYRYGYAVTNSPTSELIKLLGLPWSKVSRWLARAREEGLLGATRERQAGGVGEPGSYPLNPLLAQRGRVHQLRAIVAEYSALPAETATQLSDYPAKLAELAEAEARLAEMEGTD